MYLLGVIVTFVFIAVSSRLKAWQDYGDVTTLGATLLVSAMSWVGAVVWALLIMFAYIEKLLKSSYYSDTEKRFNKFIGK